MKRPRARCVICRRGGIVIPIDIDRIARLPICDRCVGAHATLAERLKIRKVREARREAWTALDAFDAWIAKAKRGCP